ncbi:BTAD domain-containing putative transcriptional regulator [Asanoa sp. WMMD1127]|uniref:BTAD domain-containing putative transcriptional regulator n=1 Tax=Asanoa sp. WMMD1127 TaxID=3016107 RepID=UPI0024175FBE|nr:BTAD domain-containing putative transcriptional regulator [Asanoa sp. WMMD1127]MDG4820812.1 BTAD domain-containing putative transcriptional regulator [Asanoa sp. WMMD1127]
MRVALLGSVQAFAVDGTPIELSGARLRMLLARLALDAGHPVPAEALISDLWGEEARVDAAGALHSLVARLRRALGTPATVELTPGGYRLPVPAGDVDVHRFEGLAGQGRRELAAGRCREASALLSEGLSLWRGGALTDVREAPFARKAVVRLDELRAAAEEDRFDAELRLGRYAEVLAGLQSAAAAHPLSERLAELRMRALGAAGRQSDALAVFEAARHALAEELGVDPSPSLRRAHLALLRGEFERPVAHIASASRRLPAWLTGFVGRDAELAQLGRLVTGSRLVSIVGPGGSGKTRLAVEMADAAAADRHGPCWFVPLAEVARPQDLADSVLGTLSSAFGRFYGSVQSQQSGPVDRLVELLDVDDAMLILDNCEHLIGAVAELAGTLLQRLPHLRIITTSREPVAVDGEALLRLQPLAVPALGANAVEALASPAVRLFTDRAAYARDDFVLDETTVTAVVEICRRLDGLPLALELAAARLRAMSVEQVAERLDDRFRLLTSGSRIALPRQRTLLATLEWSWELLDAAERTLASRLSVFPGGATLAALEAICTDETLPAEEVLYVLSSLIEKSIVQHSGQRYRMLESVRAFAAARLEAGIADRFSAYYLALAEEQEPLLRTRAQLEAIAQLDSEHHNLVRALRTALAASDAPTAARFVRALLWYWGIRGMTTQFSTYLDAVLDLGDAVPEDARAAFTAVRLVDKDKTLGFHPALPLLRMVHLVSQAPPEEKYRSPDPWIRASALWAHDFVLTERGDLATGTHSRHEALRGFEEVGDRWGIILCLLAIGRDHATRGEFAEAIAVFERAAVISAELNTEELVFHTRSAVARTRARSGDLEGARDDVVASMRQARLRGQRRMEAEMLYNLAYVFAQLGDLEAADRALDQLETLLHRLPFPDELRRDLLAAGRLYNRLAEGAVAGAREQLPRALRGTFTFGNSATIAVHAECVARLLMLEGEPERAAETLGMSEAIRGRSQDTDKFVARLRIELGRTLGAAGYREIYRRGAALPRQDALERIAALAAP